MGSSEVYPRGKFLSKLQNQRVLIIGGSSGVGFAVAEGVIEYGGSVIISSSQQSRLDKAIHRLESTQPSAKGRVLSHVCDLRSSELETCLTDLFKTHGSVDHIVVTAGDTLLMTGIRDATFESIIDAGRVRFFAPLLVAKIGARHLNPGPKSSITFTGAALTIKPRPGWAIVAAYATAMHGAVKGLAIDLKPIRVNVVDPFATQTEMWGETTEEEMAAITKSVVKDTLTGVFARVEDVAEAYLYAMKDNNATGSVISTNSGWPLVQ